MKTNRKTILIFLFIIFTLCCNYTNEIGINKGDSFLGDATLSNRKYFQSLISGNTKKILVQQNKMYSEAFSNSSEKKIALSKTSWLKVFKEKNKNFKVNLYTYYGNKQVDSIQFYRNISGNEFGNYHCLSYYDKKTNKIWQIQYFSTNPLRDNSSGIISYTKSDILPNGKIKRDSIYFLDESLEVLMDKYNLYY